MAALNLYLVVFPFIIPACGIHKGAYMARFCPLFSSSSGNSVYIGTADGGILIDVGVSAKRTRQALWDIGVDESNIAAIFVTHEHSDHINGLRVFASRLHLPVYCTAGTLSALDEADILRDQFNVNVIPPEGINIRDMQVKAFRTSHDSRESAGFTVTTPDQKRIAVATDTGIVTQEMADALRGCDLVMLESNHDVRMLQNGEYPYFLKRRILSDYGHLSNESCAAFAVNLVESGTARLVLGHLSRENNMPQLAYETTKQTLEAAGAAINKDYLLSIAGADCKVIGL